MVTIKAIFDKEGTASPEKECELKFGNHFDGENFYYFESEDEKVKFYESLESKE